MAQPGAGRPEQRKALTGTRKGRSKIVEDFSSINLYKTKSKGGSYVVLTMAHDLRCSLPPHCGVPKAAAVNLTVEQSE
jgi:hypothetical protein